MALHVLFTALPAQANTLLTGGHCCTLDLETC